MPPCPINESRRAVCNVGKIKGWSLVAAGSWSVPPARQAAAAVTAGNRQSAAEAAGTPLTHQNTAQAAPISICLANRRMHATPLRPVQMMRLGVEKEQCKNAWPITEDAEILL